MIMELNETFPKLLNGNGWKQSFPKSALTIMQLNGTFPKLLNGNGRNETYQKQA